jgi:hypothetical protein
MDEVILIQPFVESKQKVFDAVIAIRTGTPLKPSL